MRDERVDLLRVIGLLMIILAHVGPPSWLFQLRNFDVPLMVLISGVAFHLSYQREAYGIYVWKRIKRLLFPAWLFLSGYFIWMWLVQSPSDFAGFKIILESYLLFDGIGYVWIIRVFLLIAIVAPIILRFNEKFTSTKLFFACLLGILAAYEISVLLLKPYMVTGLGRLIESTILYIIPYAIIFSLGIRLCLLTLRELLKLTACLWLIFGIIFVINFVLQERLVYTQAFKYPPQLYYLTYALGVSCIIWMMSEGIISLVKKARTYFLIEFISQNSLWIYLWHIPFIEIYDMKFFYEYPLVTISACLVAYVQVTIVKSYLTQNMKSQAAKRNLHMLLTG